MNILMKYAVYQDMTKKNREYMRIISIEKNVVYFIPLSPLYAMPRYIKKTVHLQLIDNGLMVKVDDDPVQQVFFELSDSEKKCRDERLEIVKFVWEENKARYLNKHERWALFNEATQKFNVSPLQVGRIVSLYLQGGATENSVVPKFYNRGIPGKEKACTDKKRGRPKKGSREGKASEGINITEEIKQSIYNSVDKYYIPKKHASFIHAYSMFASEHYADKYYFNGSLKRTFGDADIPTYDQFYYWANKYFGRNKTASLFKKMGKNQFDAEVRPLMGDTSKESFGPGQLVQIDATKLPVSLVSKIRKDIIIGNIYCYIIEDYFSELIMGMHIGEGPSWAGAMMALHNVVENKVEYCARFGISITEDMWPATNMPENILGDNSELAGTCPNSLVENLNIGIDNTTPYEGNRKGLIEGYFHVLKRDLWDMPGYRKEKFRKPGEKDERLDSALTIEDITRIVIRLVIKHNNSVLLSYNKGIFHIRDSVVPKPVDLWNWGIEHRGCGCVFRDKKLVDLALMPRAMATLEREGIRFEGNHYSCSKAIEENWFVRPDKLQLPIFYDPRRIENIYIPTEDFRDYIVCHILEKYSFYKELQYEDYKAVIEADNIAKNAKENQNLEFRINTYWDNHDDAEKAKHEKSATVSKNTSKAQQVKDIRENRNNELKELGKENALNLSPSPNYAKNNVVNLKQVADRLVSDDSYHNKLLDIIEQKGDNDDDE
jgi:hypothetical protein